MVWNMSLFEHFFQGFEPLLGSWNPDPHQRESRIRIRIKVTSRIIRVNDADPQHCFHGHRVTLCQCNGTPTKRQVSKRPVSKRLKRQVYKTSGLQNIRFTKRQVYKMSGLQNVRSSKRRIAKKQPYIFCTRGWWKSAGSVAAMFAGKVMAVSYTLF
jgi:hypothetical protein